jgi:hypothetical protein
MSDPFETELDELFRRRSGDASASPDARTRIDAKIKGRIRRQRLVAGVATIVVVALVGAGVVWRQGGGDESRRVDFVDDEGADTPQSELVDAAVETGFALDREEILSAAVLGSDGDRWRPELDEQRAATNAAIADLRPLLEDLPDQVPDRPQVDCGYATQPGQTAPTVPCDQGTDRPELARLDDLEVIRAGIDGQQLPARTVIDQYGQTGQAELDAAAAALDDVEDVTAYRRLSRRLTLAAAIGYEADQAAAVVFLADLPAVGSDPSDGCPGGPIRACPAYVVLENSRTAAASVFEAWTSDVSDAEATELEVALDDPVWSEQVTSIIDAGDALVAAVPRTTDDWVTIALAHVDRLADFARATQPATVDDSASSVPNGVQIALSAAEVLSTLTREQVIAEAPGSRQATTAPPLAERTRLVGALVDLLDRPVEELPVYDRLGIDDATMMTLDGLRHDDSLSAEGYVEADAALLAIIEATAAAAPDASTVRDLEQMALFARASAALAEQRALLTAVIWTPTQQWEPGQFDRFVERGLEFDHAITTWEANATAEFRLLFRNETATQETRTAVAIASSAVDSGGNSPVDAKPDEWLPAALAQIDAYSLILGTHLDVQQLRPGD